MSKAGKSLDNYVRLKTKYQELMREMRRLEKSGRIIISKVQKIIDAGKTEIIKKQIK